FASAGHGAIYDYPRARGLQTIAEDVWDRGCIISAVCHGPAILPGVMDPRTGRSIIDGKAVTGFAIEGEVLLHVMEKIRKDKVLPIEEAAVQAGAKYISPLHPFQEYSITDGRLVTGANPASARSTADRALWAFEKASDKASNHELVGSARND